MKASLALLVAALWLSECTANGNSNAPAENGIQRRPRDAPLQCTPDATVLACKSTPKDKAKVGVVLLNMGGPEFNADVEPFLYNLFADPDIIRLPWYLSVFQKPLAFVISKARASKSQAAYNKIGGGSPIGAYTRQQAQILQRKLKSQGLDANCYVAMRYWHPLTEDTISQIQRDGVGRLIVLPLYPHYSISTSGSSLRELARHLPASLANLTTVIPFWHDRPGYVAAVAALVKHEIDKFSSQDRAAGVHILFSAHGVPKFYVETEGDIYLQHMQDSVERISAMLPSDVKVHLSFQSKVGPVEWLKPYTDQRIVELGDAGTKNLVVVPISFVSEHIETLEEIDMGYRELAHEHGIQNWQRVPALNLDDQFLTELSNVVLDAWDTQPMLSIQRALLQMDTRGEAAAVAAAQAQEDNWGPSLVLIALLGVILLLGIHFRRNDDANISALKKSN